MLAYIIRRLLILPVLITGVTMIIFAMLSLLTPYERASLYIQDIPKRPGAIDSVIEKYGLNDPIPVQYWRWMVGRKDETTGEIKGGVLRGDLGFSKVGKSSVMEVIGRRLPATAELALWAAVPMIGRIKGAMSMAPITVAVESPITPKVAITVDRNSRTTNRSRLARRLPPSMKSLALNAGRSSGTNLLSSMILLRIFMLTYLAGLATRSSSVCLPDRRGHGCHHQQLPQLVWLSETIDDGRQ